MFALIGKRTHAFVKNEGVWLVGDLYQTSDRGLILVCLARSSGKPIKKTKKLDIISWSYSLHLGKHRIIMMLPQHYYLFPGTGGES